MFFFQWKIFVEKGAEPGPGASLLRPRELRLRLPCAQHRLLQQWRPLRRRKPEVSGGWPFCHRGVASERSRDTQLPEHLKASGEKVIYNEKIQSDKEYLPSGRAKNSTNLRNQRYMYTLWIEITGRKSKQQLFLIMIMLKLLSDVQIIHKNYAVLISKSKKMLWKLIRFWFLTDFLPD